MFVLLPFVVAMVGVLAEFKIVQTGAKRPFIV